MAIRYFNNTDYQVTIDDIQLQEIYNNQRALIRVENMVIEEIRSYIIQRYDLDKEFTNTGAYSIGTTYSAADRVIIDYDAFSASSTYSYGNCVIDNGNGYVCVTASVSPTASVDNVNWAYLGAQYQIYHTKYPAQYFDNLNYYVLNDVVFYKGITYSCMTPTRDLTKTAMAQYLYDEYIPGPNVLPDDTVNNSNYQYWMPATSSIYQIPAGTLPTDTNYWNDWDNRCQLILNAAIDMVVYYLERQIAPRNINPIRKDMHKRALEWLDDVANGEFTINTPYKIPQQGFMFRSGGNPADPNNW